MRFAVLFALVAAVALTPGVALAADEDLKGFVLHVRRDAVVPAGDEVRTVVVIDADIRVAGVVENLVVVRGTAVISGRITGNITMVNGDLDLQGPAVVNDVRLVRSDLSRAPGATVQGDISRTSGTWWLGWGLFFGFLFVLGMGVALLLAGVVFAALGGPTLARAADAMSSRTGPTILAGIVTMVGLPIAAGVAVVTIVGIPVGLGILLFALPTLAFLGHIVAGTWIGSLILRGEIRTKTRPIKEALLGLVLLLVILLIPGVGWLSFVVLGSWGSGALVYLGWRNLREPAAPSAVMTGPTPETAPKAPGPGEEAPPTEAIQAEAPALPAPAAETPATAADQPQSGGDAPTPTGS